MRLTTTTIMFSDTYGLVLFTGTLQAPTYVVVMPFDGMHLSGGLMPDGDAYINIRSSLLEHKLMLKDLENHGWTNDMNGVIDGISEIIAWINGTETNPT